MDATQPDAQVQDDREARRLAACAQKWIAEITASEKAQRKWVDRSKKIIRRYKKEHGDTDTARRFAMLWTNTQTVHPAIYARPPQPEVTRRFKDADPVGRAASEVLERALSYSVDKQDLDGVLRTTTLDYCLLARGQVWERYVPTLGPQVIPQIPLQVVTGSDDEEDTYEDEDGNPYGPDQIHEDGAGGFYAEGEPYEPVIFEESITDYVNWEDFGHSVARTWDEVTFVWRRVYLSREQLKERFGENLGKLIPLDWGPIQQGRGDSQARLLHKAAIYELWDKASRKVYWISKSWASRPLDERDDPLGLDGFFPCPRPLFGTLASDSLIPVPDYKFYEDQAEEIDELTARIGVLQKALKIRGFYAADGKTNLNNLLNADTNVMIPVTEWQSLKDGGGLAGRIEWFPVANVVSALTACIDLRKQLIDDVYAITGIGDILRGMNDPRATATAEALKGQWGTLRVRERQKEVQRFARDIMRIKGEVIAEKFSADTLRAMTGLKLPTAEEKAQVQAQVQQQALQAQMAAQANPQMGHNGGPPMPPEIPEDVQALLRSPTWEEVEQLLHDNAMRQFRVDIETDSTIEPNESEEKAQTVELMTAISQMVQQWGPAIEAQPSLAPMVGELIKFALRRFRAGRQLEEIIDSTVDKLVAQAAQAQGQPAEAEKPDQTPVQVALINQQTAQMQEQAETERAQLQAQVDGAELQIEQQVAGAKIYALQRDPNPQGVA